MSNSSSSVAGRYYGTEGIASILEDRGFSDRQIAQAIDQMNNGALDTSTLYDRYLAPAAGAIEEHVGTVPDADPSARLDNAATEGLVAILEEWGYSRASVVAAVHEVDEQDLYETYLGPAADALEALIT